MAHLIGLMRLGRDAELRHTAAGEPVATLALAFNYGQKDSEGKRASQWIDAALWGKRAESLMPYLLKGTAVDVILAEPHIETYQKKDGTTGVKLAARVMDIELAGGSKRDEPARETRPAPKPPAQPSGSFDDMTDDIPF